MPDLGGLETYQAYCMAHGGRPPVPFIILTADATEECRELCLTAGIELFMTKPVSLARLQETLAAIGKREPGDSESPVAAITAQAPQDGEQPVLDETEFGNLVSLAAGNQDFLVELIRNFEADAANDIRELEAAVANRDWTAFRDSAHALKGGALYLGLSRLARLSLEAQMLEQDEFDREGIAFLRNIQRAAGEAIHALHNKGAALRQAG
jgi:two-component system sensor histidine kinase RpfC